MSLIRPLASHDLDRVYAALIALADYAPNYGWLKNPDPVKALTFITIKGTDGDAYIVDDTYLLLVGEQTAWFSDERALQEQFILQLSAAGTGNIVRVVRALETIARERGLTTILTGDSSVGLGMSAVYERANYKHMTNLFYKEL